MMIDRLKYHLDRLGLYLDKRDQWTSLLIEKYPPVIHRLAFKISDDETLMLQRILPVKNSEAYIHSHSWPFSCYVLAGGYEMGMGEGSENDRTADREIITTTLKIVPGTFYEILSPRVFHYTAPKVDSWSVVLAGKRIRERKAENNESLTESQREAIFDYFQYFSANQILTEALPHYFTREYRTKESSLSKEEKKRWLARLNAETDYDD